MAITPELIEEVKKEIGKGYTNYSYFFDELESSKWILPLYNEGFFQTPPQPKREGEYIRFPGWPESRYLVRMAAIDPEKVYKIISNLPETENIRVHEDVIEAAISMPGHLAVKLIPKIKPWINTPFTTLLPEKFANLVVHLVRENQEEKAFELARYLLTLLPESESNRTNDDDLLLYHLEPHAYFDSWHYDQVLKIILPDLTEKDGHSTLNTVSELLTQAIDFSLHPIKSDDSEDNSIYWRPSIEGPNENDPHEIKDLLVSAVRIVADEIIKKQPEMGMKILENIEGRKYKIFLRIGLYLRKTWPKIDFDGTEKLVTNPEITDDVDLHHELSILIKNLFNEFSSETKEKYLKIVEIGPKMEEFSSRDDMSEQEIEKRKEYIYKEWQFKKLWCIQEYLAVYPGWERKFIQLKEEFKDVRTPDYPVDQSRAWIGPTSPKEAVDLQSMSINDLVSYLDSWRPTERFMASSPEGLGRVLADLIGSEPQNFASEANKFKGLDPTYVRSFFYGLREAVKKNITFVWPPVLDLCSWVMDQPRDIPGRSGGFPDVDPDWGWTRKAIADLFSIGFNSGSTEMPFECRSKVWDILRPITDDPDPTPEHEEKYGDTNMDPPTLSINTTRGEAMHAVIRYALWAQSHLEQTDEAKESATHSFDEIPEVQEVLEYHLQPANDPSLAIRSVYGRWFPQLAHHIDKDWTKKNLNIIFPHKTELQEFYNATWETYIKYHKPYDEVFELLRGEYVYAIEKLTSTTEEQDTSRYEEKLVEHLILLYCRNKIDYDKDGFLDKFYQKASDKLCGRVIWFLHRILKENDPISTEIIEKIMKLWEKRIEEIQGDPDAHKTELSSYSWLFASGKLDDKWAIEHLKQVLEITDSEIDIRERHVVKKLAEISKEMPLQTIETFELVVNGIKNEWAILGWKDHAKAILENVLNSKDEKARIIASQLTNKIGSWGHLEFRELLK